MIYKQSLSYSRDLIKATKLEIPKKKLILPFKGTATVKLYDALTRKQTYEAKSENRISAVFGNIAYLDGFYYPILDNIQENILSDIYTTYPFRVMVLTTGDTAEDPYDYFTWGSIIGYADGWYTYSGSDVLRGTVNKSETTRSNTDAAGTRHYVIDFPTSVANGTFKSIYWTGGSSTQDTAQSPKINSLYPKAALEAGTSSTSLPNYNLCTDETNLYALIKNATSLVAYDKTTAVKKDNITLSVQAKAIAYDGTNFWILISDSSFKKLNKDFTVISSYPKSAAVPDDLVYDVEYFDIAVNDAYI